MAEDSHYDRQGTVTEVERQTIRDAVLAALEATFGLWTTSTKKVLRWELVPQKVHIVLLEADCGTIVVPFHAQRDKRPYFGEVSTAQLDASGSIISLTFARSRQF